MSAIPGSITWTATLDLSQAYQQYQQFLAYVAANPVPIGTAGGLGGGGGVGATSYVYNTTNRYVTINQGPVTINRGGTGGGAGGGRAGGGGGRRSGRRSSGFGRVLQGYFLARQATRLVQDAGNYAVRAASAGGPAGQLQAEQSLQSSLFSIPIAGQLASIASLPFRLGTDETEQSARQQDKFTEGLSRFLDQTRSISERSGIAQLGPTDAARDQEIENREKAEIRQIQREAARLDMESAETRDKEISAAHENSGLGFLSDQEDRDTTSANVGYQNRSRAIYQREHEAEANLQAERDARERENAYQRQQSLTRAQQGTRIADLDYQRQPDVAHADEIFYQGQNRAEEARHRGRPEEASQYLQQSRFRLLGFQREILEGGSAEEVENPFATSFGTPGPGGQVSEDVQKDDTAEALSEISQKLDQLDQLNQTMLSIEAKL